MKVNLNNLDVRVELPKMILITLTSRSQLKLLTHMLYDKQSST
jgi:hypothetical protein